MKCVKDCYFKVYIRTENRAEEILYKGYYCELYEKRLEKRQIGTTEHGNVHLFEIVRCKECENHETLYYSKKMNIFKRMVLRNAEERMDTVETSER